VLAPAQSPRSPVPPPAAHPALGASPARDAPPPSYEDTQERDRRAIYLRDQARTLYCHGEHSPTIAVELEVPERTVRSWLQQTREELAAELPDLRRTHLLLAVDSLRELLATTWELLEAECHADLPLLSDYANCTPPERLNLRPRHSNAPRYLALAASLQKELNRLLALADPGLPVSPPANENPAETAMPPASSTPAQAGFVAAGPQTPGSPTGVLFPPPILLPRRPQSRQKRQLPRLRIPSLAGKGLGRPSSAPRPPSPTLAHPCRAPRPRPRHRARPRPPRRPQPPRRATPSLRGGKAGSPIGGLVGG
jgi:Putative ATPase subunit of terminase (gpP-like)